MGKPHSPPGIRDSLTHPRNPLGTPPRRPGSFSPITRSSDRERQSPARPSSRSMSVGLAPLRGRSLSLGLRLLGALQPKCVRVGTPRYLCLNSLLRQMQRASFRRGPLLRRSRARAGHRPRSLRSPAKVLRCCEFPGAGRPVLGLRLRGEARALPLSDPESRDAPRLAPVDPKAHRPHRPQGAAEERRS